MDKLKKELSEIMATQFVLLNEYGYVIPGQMVRYRELVRQADLLRFKIGMEAGKAAVRA
jgi:hypothetical protein